MRPLTTREWLFVEGFFTRRMGPTDAARFADYKHPEVQGFLVLKRERVLLEIDRRKGLIARQSPLMLGEWQAWGEQMMRDERQPGAVRVACWLALGRALGYDASRGAALDVPVTVEALGRMTESALIERINRGIVARLSGQPAPAALLGDDGGNGRQRIIDVEPEEGNGR